MRSDVQLDSESLDHLRSEVSFWEAAMALGEKVSPKDRTMCEDATILYIIISSLLVKQLSTAQGATSQNATSQALGQVPQPVETSCWQLDEMAEIIQRRADDGYWIRCFVANWPMYTAGFLLTDPTVLKCVRNDLWERWSASRFSQVARYRDDFEKILEQRQLLRSSASQSPDGA